MNFTPKNPKKFFCEKCAFSTSNKKDYERHLGTLKHINTTKYNHFTPKNPKPFQCECGKSYPYRSSLYNHKKNCNILTEKNNSDNENIDYKELLLNMVKDNKNLCKELLSKQTNYIGSQIIGDNNTVTQQNFNINIFLNEQCKDALTMNEFIDKIKITLDNLIVTKDKGITEGVSNIFIENMNKLSLYERPLHCTDPQQETVYIKCDEDKKGTWERDNHNIKLKEALKKVSLVQQKNLDKWTKENPNWDKSSILQEEYLQLIKNCTDDFDDCKTVKKICNNNLLDQNNLLS